VTPFARINFGYTYEVDEVGIDATLLGSALGSAGAPALSAGELGRHVDGRVSLGIVHGTIDNTFMPHDGVRLSAGMQLASRAFGGDFDYIKPEAEATWYRSTGRHTGVGLRAQVGAIETYGATADVPYSIKYELGGENQIRGVDLRTGGPLDANGRVLGGTRFTLFNADYHVDLTSRIRVLAFGDAGQSFDAAHPFDLGNLRTSTGVELRVVLPFIHLPVRFTYYWNPSRDSFQPSRGFRFSIGTSF
jgi:outer membrane protein insertion porin family